MIEGKDIFCRLMIHFFTTSTYLTRQKKFHAVCSLCGDEETGVCAGCVQILINLSRDQKKEIYIHLKDIGDKKRAETLAKHFIVHPPGKPIAQIQSPTTDSPNKVISLDVVRIRKKLGLTQNEMAEKLGISKQTLSLGERGKRPLPAKTKAVYTRLKARV